MIFLGEKKRDPISSRNDRDSKPLVSVVMSVYNETKRELSAAIESILRQTYANLEFIIIIDNPDNEIINRVVRRYEALDERIRIIHNDSNLGVALSLNKGIMAARGKYIARMDADDISLTKRIEIEVDYMENNINVDLVCGKAMYMNEKNHYVKKSIPIYRTDAYFMKALLYGHSIIHPSVLMRRDRLIQVGLYNNCINEDYELWSRMVESGYVFHYINEPVIKYRLRRQGATARNRERMFVATNYIRGLALRQKDFDQAEYETAMNSYIRDETYMKQVSAFLKAASSKNPIVLMLCCIKNRDCAGYLRCYVKRYVLLLESYLFLGTPKNNCR